MVVIKLMALLLYGLTAPVVGILLLGASPVLGWLVIASPFIIAGALLHKALA